MTSKLETLQEVLSYRFTNLDLVRRALTHRSANQAHNERLEFLGDSLLGFIVAEYLHETFPAASEGELSRRRSSLVKKESLVAVARELRLGDHINLGVGELKSGGQHRDSILADAVEALIAAIYLDGGMQACKPVVERWCTEILGKSPAINSNKDAKTRLQELMQALGKPLPEYMVTSIEGEAHQQIFHVKCRVEPLRKSEEGSGSSKRLAEQQAAGKILIALGAAS